MEGVASSLRSSNPPLLSLREFIKGNFNKAENELFTMWFISRVYKKKILTKLNMNHLQCDSLVEGIKKINKN